MPIHRSIELQDVGDLGFAELDAVVMRCAYETQNAFGRLFDERVYENDLAFRLRAEGLDVRTQGLVAVWHRDFVKSYYLDLVVNQMVYELKAVSALLREHYAQVLNYAMLQDVRLVKLINFGGVEVSGRLLRNALTEEERYRPVMRKSGWRPLGLRCEELIAYLKEVIRDWGTHLDCLLYNEVLVHHFGGESNCLRRVEVWSGDVCLGTHLVQMYDPEHAFAVTGFTRPQAGYRQHLLTLLEHVPGLKGIQWI